MVHQASSDGIRLRELIAALEKMAHECASRGERDPRVVIFANYRSYMEPRHVRLHGTEIRIE